MFPPVQERPSAYELVPRYCLPLTRTARRVDMPYEVEHAITVGRDDPGAPVQELLSAHKPTA